MIANTITLIRLLLTLVVVALLGQHRTLDTVLIATIVIIFVLDGLDGYIARKRNETSETGALLDTVADRVIENTFWIYFTVTAYIPLWVPIMMMARGFITDNLQRQNGYPQQGWTHALTRSRSSRAVSGVTKMLAFTSLASVTVNTSAALQSASSIFVVIAVAVCLLRGLPFFFPTRNLHETSAATTQRQTALSPGERQ